MTDRKCIESSRVQCSSAFLIAALLLLFSERAFCVAPRDSSPPATRDFSFVHMSDTHIDPWLRMPSDDELTSARSYPAVKSIAKLGAIRLAPYDLTAPKPSFAIHTGDICEFGAPGFTWKVADRYFTDLGMPVFFASGNHDNTWVSSPQHFRQLYGGINHSFDYQGCHFMALCSGSLQDPSPAFGKEVLEFVRKDLANVSPSTPVFPFFHHPLYGSEFCSPYDSDRLLEILRPYNVPLILDGHGHASVVHHFKGIDGVMGGSTFAARAGLHTEGYNIVYVHGDDLAVAYRLYTDPAAEKRMIRKKIPHVSGYPVIEVTSPHEAAEIPQSQLRVSALIDAATSVTRAWYELDDQTTGALSLENRTATGLLNLDAERNGAHYLRINFALPKGGEPVFKTVSFYLERKGRQNEAQALWRFAMGGGSKTTPLVAGGRVYVGANDCNFYALDETSGKLIWKYDAGGEILSTPVEWKDLILFGCAKGIVALTHSGKAAWTHPTPDAVFSSPVLDSDGNVFFGTNGAHLIALNAETGKLLWENTDASYSIESKPAVTSNTVYFGAWDGNLYALDKNSGKTLWKQLGVHSRETSTGLSRYYAPADNGPATNGSNVFIADRGYMAGKYSTSGEFLGKLSEDCTALTLSADGSSLYIRGTKTPIGKMDLDGKPLWKSKVTAGRIPVSPTEQGELLYVCTNSGTLYALNAKTGESEWTYQVSPHLFVMAGIAVHNNTAFTAGLDGYVTAISKQ